MSPGKPNIKKYTTTALIFILFILFFATVTFYQKLVSCKHTIQKQTDDIINLQLQLETALENLHNVEKELEKYMSLVQTEKIEQKYGLVKLIDVDPTFIIDLKYASDDNFVKQQVYPQNADALLRKSTAMKLKSAHEIFKKDGYRIKVFDAYRPQHVQFIFWYFMPDTRFVADPMKGSKHNRGTAVDITLVDEDGKEIEMGTEFDNFTERAAHDHPEHTETALNNMRYLRNVMEEVGFKGISSEWWHFDDVDWREYDLLDISFDKF